MAKPLLNFFFPELTGFVQPLAGEFAASRDLLLRAPFLTGYGVEIAILIDVLNRVGLSAMAQVDLGSRQNRHQPLWDLTRMSSAVLRALARRVPALDRSVPAPRAPGLWDLPGPGGPETYLHAVGTQDGLRLDEHLSELLERPPMAQVLPALQPEVPAYQANMLGARLGEDLQDLLAVPGQLGLAHAIDQGQPGQRRRRRRRDLPQGRVVEDHVRRHALFLRDRGPPGAQPLEYGLSLRRQFGRRDRQAWRLTPRTRRAPSARLRTPPAPGRGRR